MENRQELKRRTVESLGEGTRLVRVRFAADRATFVDSSGWGVLVGLARRAQEAGARLVLVNVDAGNLDYLALTRLDAFFTREAEEPDRLAA
jgi:anti-anti-sigma factor